MNCLLFTFLLISLFLFGITESFAESEDIIGERCGVDTVFIDGVCQVVKVKTVGDDALFFGFFA